MPTTQTLLWIALPNGVRKDRDKSYLRLSIFVNPRLSTDEGTKLALFPDFLHWENLMQPDKVQFTIEVDDGTEVQTNITSAPPDKELWTKLFTPDIPVHPHKFDDFSNRPIVSFPVRKVLNYLKERYQIIGSQFPNDFPFIKPTEPATEGEPPTMKEIFEDIVLIHRESEEPLNRKLASSIEYARKIARQRHNSASLGGELISPTGIGDPDKPTDSFYRTMLFHYRSSTAKPIELPKGEAAREHFQNDIDFHQMISSMGDYPQLLRLLGLIIDLEVDAEKLPASSDQTPQRKLRIVPNWTSNFPIRNNVGQLKWTYNYSPWTVYTLTKPSEKIIFTAFSQNGEMTGGLLKPGQNNELVQVDVDGAALKSINLAATLAQVGEDDTRSIDASTRSSVPALRTNGISIVRSGNAIQMNETFNRSAALNRMLINDPPQVTDLYAEDLTRGYRLDVYGEGKWQSLHQRIGKYTILNEAGTVLEISDEGFTQPSLTSPAQTKDSPPDPGQEIFLHETLFTWNGWSLSAPRPGRSINKSPNAPNPDDSDTMPDYDRNTAMTHLGIETNFKVKEGTLPRLRFGKYYSLRIRTVDLAGNSLTLDEANEMGTLLSPAKVLFSDFPYCRFEPINPPELVPRQLYSPDGNTDGPNTTGFSEGESLERMVIRSNFDKSAKEYATTYPAYQPANERHIVPPKASLHLIETHGMLDEAFDAKNSGLPDNQIRAKVLDVYNHAKKESGSLNDTSIPSVRFIRIKNEASSTDGYAVHTEEQFQVPYLTDPWATGVVFQGLPGTAPGEVMRINFDIYSWDEAYSFRLRLEEGSGAPEWDATTQVLTIKLDKANTARIRLSSMFGGNLETMGMWQWLIDYYKKGGIPDIKFAELERDILDSLHWMFTPFREITLVHAVQQPLYTPDQSIEMESRGENSTAAYLKGIIRVDSSSTSKVDIIAEWNEPRDDLSKDMPDTVNISTHVMELPVTLDGQDVHAEYVEAPDILRLEHDSLIFNSLQASDALQGLKEELKRPDLTKQQYQQFQNLINLSSKVKAHEFGDTRYRKVSYKVSATSRFREYFDQSKWDNITRTSDVMWMEILSSSRPAAPRVLYVLPTFGWKQTADANGNITSVRSGGSLRVYLDRPWWSSGDGEMLGLVLCQNNPDSNDPSYNYSTFWGQDPIWESPGLPLPILEDFEENRHKYIRVMIAEIENTFARVIGFEVNWDNTRKLWYCDLELHTGDAYYPFIRLALARFQPNSLVYKDQYGIPWLDFRLSPIVLADLVQTVPNRTVTVVKTTSMTDVYNISVTGVSYKAQAEYTSTQTQIDVTLQRHISAIEDESLAWTDLPVKVELTPGTPDEHGIVVWQGTLIVPMEYSGNGLRLLVEEYEKLPVATPQGTPPTSGNRRMYVDTIAL